MYLNFWTILIDIKLNYNSVEGVGMNWRPSRWEISDFGLNFAQSTYLT